MKLYYKDTDREVKPGDEVTSFRGEQYIVDEPVGQPPKHSGSTGRIHVIAEKRPMVMYPETYYPPVFDCEWREV